MKTFSSFLLLWVACSQVSATVYFKESFDTDAWKDRWIQSKFIEEYGKFDVGLGKFNADEATSRGLKTTEDAKHYAISAPLDKKFDNKDKQLVVQFTTKHEQNIDCGGGYIKLLPDMDPLKFNGDTPYSIMFGSDICGPVKLTQVILTSEGKNHMLNKAVRVPTDQLTHLYTFIINPDQTYKVLIDNVVESEGIIYEMWDVLPEKKIRDPNAKKPDDWDERKYIPDPEDKKPDGWDDEPEYIPDPEAVKPEDWNDEEDGDWEAPKIKNPKFGEWQPKVIENPDFKGIWIHPMIDNPDYKIGTEYYRFPDTSYVGFDLWQVVSGSIFDDIIVADSVDDIKEFTEMWLEKSKLEKVAFDRMVEEEKKKAEEEKQKAEEEAAKAKEEAEKAEKEAEEKKQDSSDDEELAMMEKEKAEEKEEVKEAVHDEL